MEHAEPMQVLRYETGQFYKVRPPPPPRSESPLRMALRIPSSGF